MDLKAKYYQLSINGETWKFATFSTSWRNYRPKRLILGAKSLQDLFDQVMFQMSYTPRAAAPLYQLLKTNTIPGQWFTKWVHRGISNFFTATKGEHPRKNKRTIWVYISSKRKKGCFVTLHSLCICRLTLACILRETSTKCTNNVDIFLRWFARPLRSSSGFSSRLSDFCWLWHSLDSPLKADRSPLPTVVDCLSASTFAKCPLWVPLTTSLSGFLCQQPLWLLSDQPFLPQFRSRRRSRTQAFVRFHAKTKKSSAWRTTYKVSHTYRVSQCIWDPCDC